MDVYWLEQTQGDVPAGNDWLCPGEIDRLNAMRFAKRRTDWRLGRWTAKCAVAAHLKVSHALQALAKIEIRPAASGAPEVFFTNIAAPVTISISHRAKRATCAVASSGVRLGCDLEVVEPRTQAFVSDYFVAEEQALVVSASPSDRYRLLALLWSAKESALKALHEGLRLDTRDVVVCPDLSSSDSSGWSRLHVACADGQIFQGWWRSEDSLLRTVVADPTPDQPIDIKIPACSPDHRFLDHPEGSQGRGTIFRPRGECYVAPRRPI
jgi:4'-phosphopantetheinyl transferase